jgi:hypothetical protein
VPVVTSVINSYLTENTSLPITMKNPLSLYEEGNGLSCETYTEHVNKLC